MNYACISSQTLIPSPSPAYGGRECVATLPIIPALQVARGGSASCARMRALFYSKVVSMSREIRNIAIIAHVDHGKTTLVDKLLSQAGSFASYKHIAERVMDSNDLERERGITILAKNCAVDYEGVHINIVDTPGHADFGGEVERVLGMVDGVLLLVDAVEGPMPQTRFVTKKALALGLHPIVVINKVDRDGARPDWVINKTFDLFDNRRDRRTGFPVVYASLNSTPRWIWRKSTNMRPLLMPWQACSTPDTDVDAPLQLQISALDYSSFVGRIGVGRVRAARQARQEVMVMSGDKAETRINQVLGFRGIGRGPLGEALAGDIVLINGIDEIGIGVTLADMNKPEALPMPKVDESTLTMNLMVNTSPLCGQEGKLITSRQIRDRLTKELLVNVALRVEETDNTDVFLLAGRGELHLTILLENMRREGFEMGVGKPRVVYREINGEKCEPFEVLTVDVEDTNQGAVMEELGRRRGDLQDMQPDGHGRVRLEYRIPARGLIGFQSEFMTMTRGTGIMAHVFDDYAPVKAEMPGRRNGVLISAENGEAVAYALWKLEDRGRMIVVPGDKLYEGMIIGIHSRDNDLIVNPIKGNS